MREIKFRVWNRDRKMFIINGMTPKQIQDDAIQSLELPLLTSEDCAWQQYTGFKDKNGIEIYDGDLIYLKNSFMYPKMISEIIWDNGWFADNKKLLVRWCISVNFTSSVKIVGNIFEGVVNDCI